ncbi:MAG: TIGR03435 family protein [Terracidiphilus sp.]
MTSRVFLPQPSAATAALLLAACFALAASAYGQAKPGAANGITSNPPSFDVVSVRPAKPDCYLSMAGPAHGRYTGRCITLWAMIYNAYEVRSFQDYPPGLPAWADKDKFDIEAKADDDTTAAMEELSMQERGHMGRAMLQSLLADRFKLRVHYKSKVQPVYDLVLAKGGFKLKPLSADQKPGGMSGGPGMMIIHGMPIAAFAHFLSQTNLAGRIVIDKTGLTGNYEIDLKWTPDDQQGTPDAGPTFFTALEEQLGLKLVPAKVPVDVLVIDHAERPSEN